MLQTDGTRLSREPTCDLARVNEETFQISARPDDVCYAVIFHFPAGPPENSREPEGNDGQDAAATQRGRKKRPGCGERMEAGAELEDMR